MIETYLSKSKIITHYKKIDFSNSINNEELPLSIRNNLKNGSELFEVYFIIYKVDNLNIKGFITIPKNLDLNKINKTAICLRGGNNGFGMLYGSYTINESSIYSILPHLGYITFYTQYRGEASGEGFDQFGGEDINDVLKLFDIIKEMPFCDSENIIIMGASRGGMMAYQALTYELPVSKAIIIAGPADMNKSLTDGWRKGWREYMIEKNFFDINDKNELDKRSAVTFAKDIKNIPILIIHGTNDDRVRVQDSIDIHKLLPQSELYLSEGDGHNLTVNRIEITQKIEEFLNN